MADLRKRSRIKMPAADRRPTPRERPVPQAAGANLPTLPTMPGLRAERSSLLGGLAFLEGVKAGWGEREVEQWLSVHLVTAGKMEKPDGIHDDGAKVAFGRAAPEAVTRILGVARDHVVNELRGLLSSPPRDRFLQSAIFAGRVRRASSGGGAWHATPARTDALGEIVLSLFAADILMYREFHERSLCICDVCDRVSFNASRTTRSGCEEHRPTPTPRSGTRKP